MQLAGVPLPITRVGRDVSTARPWAGTAAWPSGLPYRATVPPDPPVVLAVVVLAVVVLAVVVLAVVVPAVVEVVEVVLDVVELVVDVVVLVDVVVPVDVVVLVGVGAVVDVVEPVVGVSDVEVPEVELLDVLAVDPAVDAPVVVEAPEPDGLWPWVFDAGATPPVRVTG